MSLARLTENQAQISQTAKITKKVEFCPSEDALEGALKELPIQSIVQTRKNIEGLSELALARRLGVDKSGLRRWKENPDKLASYTRERDPEGRAWKFQDGKFFPLTD